MKHLLHLLLPVLIFSSAVKVANAQYVTIPDTNFVNWLNANGYSQCMNGNQMDTTCNAVVNEDTIYCTNSNIHDLTGITYFDNLKVLDCWGDSLTSLPVLPNNLTYLSCPWNQLTYIVSFPKSIKQIWCHGNLLNSLPPLPDSLLWLYCNWNNLTSLPSLPDSLVELDCAGNLLTSLPNLPSKFGTLDCNYNQLTSLPALPNSFLHLYCENNHLISLPTLPSSVSIIRCYNNNISNLPPLPSALTNFNCSSNQITNIPALPSFLQEFYCNYNNISSIPTLPLGIKILECVANNITVLPSLPNSLNTLNCYGNQLISLPTLPNSLNKLNCSDNQLTSLPTLPNSLSELSCGKNYLVNLPPLPPALNRLACSFNQITQIPTLPQSLTTWLYCNNNQLTSLPDFPDSINFCNCDSNPNLTCFPMLKRIVVLSFNGTQIQCLPNYGTVTNSTPLLSSLPLCDLFNVNGCQSYWNISGKVYTDTNNNCTYEVSERKLGNMKLLLYDSIGNLLQQTFTGGEGLFSFDTDTGNYSSTVDTTNIPVLVSCPVSGFQISNLTTLDSMDYGKDFGIQCKPGFDIGVNAVVKDSGIFRPANFTKVTISAGDISNKFGLHCANGLSGTITVVISGPASYISPAVGALTPIVNGDTLTYLIADFGNLNFYSDFKIQVQTDTLATIGNQVCFDVNVTPSIGDNYSANNSLQYCFNVVNSYDPNVKEVYPGNFLIQPLSMDTLTYTINFQNTGNAIAQHIYILDTLDAAIDVSTFELLGFSFQPQVQVIGNVVRFNFPNINLPDSGSNEPGSHGYVQFRVRLKAGLTLGTTISNTSYIYFDFNSPVQTNTVVNTISDCSNFASFDIYNPALCKGDTLFAHATLPYPSSVEWYVDSILVSTNQSISIPNLGDSLHEIRLVATNNFCSDDAVVNIQFHDLPVINLGNDTSNCVQYLIDAGAGFSVYQWSNGETTQSVVANLSSLYTVAVTDANGCKNNDAISIIINPLPQIELGNDTATCNMPLQLDAGAGNISYQWSNGNTTQSIVANLSSLYSVTVTDANGCSSVDSISITINPLPSISFNAFAQDTICLTHGIQIISNGNPPGGILSGAGVSGNLFDPTIAGVGLHYITYEYTDSLGCSSAATDSVLVDLCLVVVNISGYDEIKVYPNPATNSITILGGEKNTNHRQLSLFIYDLFGKQLKSVQLKQQKTVFEISDLAAGNYLIKIFEEGNLKTIQKLVKMNE